ncbi:hypothetical protein J5J86_14120 [Aquabacter sp. L1I39]|uniref:hypothetical protein n=1 Tax=Aquabacter sp. L1I39 TaxID=2820278 RepID=UPI001AD9D249|nr:hypothetical protein [Aquabacter sp. L1I39]QTL01942.1 hypothetical protein J5J86_14120 [Aquabacter sp. L1I39]
MTAAPLIWSQTATGRAVDLLAPQPHMIDLAGDVAGGLARQARFAGQVASGPYSVAQHSVLGTDAILAETGDAALAKAFLLHDAHEAFIGDIVTPAALAIAYRQGAAMAATYPASAPKARLMGEALLHNAIADQKKALDEAIYAAAGLPWPLAPALATEVLHWDLRMLALERRDLLARPPHSWGVHLEKVQPAPHRGRIRVWPWPDAADAFRARLFALFPHLAPIR